MAAVQTATTDDQCHHGHTDVVSSGGLDHPAVPGFERQTAPPDAP
jgi:hypothetical protein